MIASWSAEATGTGVEAMTPTGGGSGGAAPSFDRREEIRASTRERSDASGSPAGTAGVSVVGASSPSSSYAWLRFHQSRMSKTRSTDVTKRPSANTSPAQKSKSLSKGTLTMPPMMPPVPAPNRIFRMPRDEKRKRMPPTAVGATSLRLEPKRNEKPMSTQAIGAKK